NARHEALHRTRNQVLIVTASERVVEGTVDLIQIEVVCRSPRGEAASTEASLVNCLHQRVNLVCREEAGLTTLSTGADVEDANAVVRIQDGNRVGRAELKPSCECRHVARVQ